MKLNLKVFQRDEDGAVTVDWVVLTAAIIGLGMVVVAPIAFETDNASQRIGDSFSTHYETYQKN